MNNHIELKIFPTIEEVSLAAVEIFADLLCTEGKNTFLVPGGGTPYKFYRHLAEKINNWRDTTLLLSDERLVQEHLPESNFGMIKRNLVDLIKMGKPPELVSVINGFSPKHSSQIIGSLNLLTRSLLPPKAAFLGIGTDGHTASIFPKAKNSFLEKEPFILIKRSLENFQRVSVSERILIQTPLLIFLVSGSEKKPIIERLFNRHDTHKLFPMRSIVKQALGRVIVLCDLEAAPDQMDKIIC